MKAQLIATRRATNSLLHWKYGHSEFRLRTSDILVTVLPVESTRRGGTVQRAASAASRSNSRFQRFQQCTADALRARRRMNIVQIDLARPSYAGRAQNFPAFVSDKEQVVRIRQPSDDVLRRLVCEPLIEHLLISAMVIRA
ncbi:MAG TPA: hypothetical protein VFJ56_07925 [Nitrospira sp.]|nr:hypothetical protein [Nitrospira sp.]